VSVLDDLARAGDVPDLDRGRSSELRVEGWNARG
jgi:hypothetical protein